MSKLNRELAPISSQAWTEIDAEAQRTLKRILSARRLVDFDGPLGYGESAIGRGRLLSIKPQVAGVTAAIREVQPLVEHKVSFDLDPDEIEAIDRGARDPDLEPLVKAVQIAGLAEDTAVFSGTSEAGIRGIIEVAERHALTLTTDYEQYPIVVASALTWLRNQGIGGPYHLALGSRCYQGLTETSNKGGYPILELVKQQIDGGIVWAPAIDGAVLLSCRGGDFELFVGRDFAIGYAGADKNSLSLFVEESFTFMTHTPEAAVPLLYREKGA